MTEAHALLDAMSVDAAREALTRCCGAGRWVEAMLARRPFGSAAGLRLAAREAWARMAPSDILEAFAHHPEIGEKLPAPAAWARQEQALVAQADAATRAALHEGNASYRARFGFIFLVCASGKSAAEMLELLRARLVNDPGAELAIAAAEQAKITQLRLEKLAP